MRTVLSSILALFLFLSLGLKASDLDCLTTIRESLKERPQQEIVFDQMLEFAKKHNLKTQILELGPEGRKVKRLFVAIDHNDAAQMKAYHDAFNLSEKGKDVGGTNFAGSLSIEAASEPTPEQYVTMYMRTGKYEERDKVYRFDKTGYDLNFSRTNEIIGFSHVFGLTEDEMKNARFFLDHPDERGPLKSKNCVTFIPSLLLSGYDHICGGEKQALFKMLGMSRTKSPWEIARRLTHAANHFHSTTVVYVNGEAGLKAFDNLAEYLPPEPKVPYESVIHGFGFAKDSEIMKSLEKLPSTAKIFTPIAAGISPDFMQALYQRAGLIQTAQYNIDMFVNGVSATTLSQMANLQGGKFKLNALFLGGNARQLHKQGKVEYTPGYLRDAAVGIHNRDPEYKYDIVAVRVSPPDENGYHSLGPNHDMIMTLIERQPNVKIIAEINPNVPRTRGTNKIKGHRFFASYHSDSQLAGPVVVPYTPVEKAIGEYVAELIPNDANLQIGIGNLFNGLPDAIKAKGTQRIKMYSEMISDSAMNMVENGNVERIKTGFAFGSTDFYKWLDGNQKVEFASTLEVNDIAKISKKNRMHAVNTALQVNLKGDVNATMGPNNARISSPGGQAEFMQGAKLSKQGKSIIAIRSTAKMGEISTIALNLYGDSITTPHENVSHVVTEYGIAVLKNKSERERALALIKISHPKFRKELAEDAYLSDIITEQDLTTIRYNDKEIPLEIVDEAIEEAAEEAPKA